MIQRDSARKIPERRRLQMLKVMGGQCHQHVVFFMFALNAHPVIADWALQYLILQGRIGHEFDNWYRRDFESDPQKLIRHLYSIAPKLNS